MKGKRNLSGIFFRFKNPETKEWENRTFEDLQEKMQNEYMANHNIDWTKSLAKQLADAINELGNKFNLIKE